ncbi:MAG: pyridoxamine 5'-phosphate oxidase family protein [Defluviicoccus sp.]|nr:pyridoxamine 5'-phosphate oxidase family protein [Defluviicoccus sp.]MDE0274380.1 pyridoxamine 5'-phosphate oxidase family protein [Defluviicoccus sp.]
MPDQHRDFYGALPFVLVGTVDGEGWPWASIVPGRPGFITSPDPRTLDIGAPPLHGDPLRGTLKGGVHIGLLGIEPHTRRRNRMTGRVASVRGDGFTIAVNRTFGNCTQYIQTRSVELGPDIDGPRREREVFRSDRFDDDVCRIVERTDTLFVASAHLDENEPDAQGADVSHRGGKPGFVRIEDRRTFAFPDFSGNNHFNTVGNILLNPKAGFLFIDFESGDLVYLTGDAEIVWSGAEVDGFRGAQRLIRFHAEQVIRVANALPLRFAFGEYSPLLKETGSWELDADTGELKALRHKQLRQ